MSQSSLAVDINKIDGASRDSLADSVAIEEPLEIRLGYSTPDGRAVNPRPSLAAKVVALPRLGGLHHRYDWREAA